MENWESTAIQDEFLEAVKHVGTKPGLELSEAVQSKLYGLHCVATKGAPPATAPADLHEEQWKAWCAVQGRSREAAMQEYIDMVSQHDPSFSFVDGVDVDMSAPGSELPAGIMDALAAAGYKAPGANAPGAPEIRDVFAAARDGLPLAAFLPGDRDAVDEDGLTPLIHAVDAEQGDAVAQLLLAGANTNASDPQGQTALHYAALLGADTLCEQLLAGGADPCVKDEDGASPADIARSEGHTTLAEKLSEASAR